MFSWDFLFPGFLSLHVLRWQMSCASTQTQDVSFLTESVRCRRWWVSIWRCPPLSSFPLRWRHSSPRYSTWCHLRWFYLSFSCIWMCFDLCCLFLQEEKDMWQKRPCALPLLKVMSLSVIHLQPLRLVLMDTLMTDYMTLVDSYLNSSHYQPDELDHVAMVSNSQISCSCFFNFHYRLYCGKKILSQWLKFTHFKTVHLLALPGLTQLVLSEKISKAVKSVVFFQHIILYLRATMYPLWPKK